MIIQHFLGAKEMQTVPTKFFISFCFVFLFEYVKVFDVSILRFITQ